VSVGVSEPVNRVGNPPDDVPRMKCGLCPRMVGRGCGIACSRCSCLFHLGCVFASRGQSERVNRGTWRCSYCFAEERRVCGDSDGRAYVASGVDSGSGGGVIRVLQWNVDHLLAKVPELEVWLQEKKIDVALLQESKLRAEDGAVSVRGYNVVRRDRCRGMVGSNRGGGLVCLIRSDWSWCEVDCRVPVDSGLEALCVDVFDGSKRVWHVLNVYVPPVNSFNVDMNVLDRLPDMSEGRWIVGGDWNAHDVAWDEFVESDSRGADLVTWADGRGLHVLNDGSATRLERGSGRPSVPDVSLVSSCLRDICRWSVSVGFTSDHLPVVIDVGGNGRDERPPSKRLMWDWNNADWSGFRDYLSEVAEQYDWEGLSMSEFERLVRESILYAAEVFVGRKRVSVEGDVGLNAEVRDAIAWRDGMRESGVSWEDVRAADRYVDELMRDCKRRQWDSLLRRGAECGEMWNVVKGVSRRMNVVERKGEALKYQGRLLLSDRAKANAFVKVYEKVSRVEVPKDRRLKKELNERLRGMSVGPQRSDCLPVSLDEVYDALRDMDGCKAAGPDGLHPRMLKSLPDSMIEVVCRLFARSLKECWVPQGWRVGEIIPLLKAGKPASDLGSYRPVCLTSCLGKWFERVVAKRMRWMLEKNGALSECQAGFREGRGVNDQLLRLSQSVHDAFQRREKSGLMLFDLSRAYDRVWRDGLLWKLCEVGISAGLVRWLQVWLSNRIAWVKVNGIRGRRRLFAQGLPQGSVLSPLLFVVYIDDLLHRIPGDVHVSAFADDLAVWCSNKSVRTCSERLQRACDVVVSWCDEWMMKLAANKCSVSLFSMSQRDASMSELRVCLFGEEVAREKRPCFLGVTFDSKLVFQAHVDGVVAKARKRLNVLRKLAGCAWGWGKGLMRNTYVALVRSVLLYGVCAWGPWLSESGWLRLERVQYEAGRIICGMLRSAPCEAVLVESGLVELRKLARFQYVLEMDKCRRVAETDFRRVWGFACVRRRLKKVGWREEAVCLEDACLPVGVGRCDRNLSVAPWCDWSRVSWLVDGRKGVSSAENREMGLNRLRGCGERNVWIFTDGSAGGLRNGGAGVVVCGNSFESPVVRECLELPAGVIASSFQAELHGVLGALVWLRRNVESWVSACVVSDSQSVLVRLRGCRGRLCDGLVARCSALLEELCMMRRSIAFAWVPGHCMIAGNELADAAAGRACGGVQSGVECLPSSVKTCAKSLLRRNDWSHERCGLVYGAGLRVGVEADWSRSDAVCLARLRSGHCLELGEYRLRVGLSDSGLCRMCGDEVECLQHVWKCSRGELARRIRGLAGGLSDLCRRPAAALDYWRWWRRTRPR